MSEPMVNNNPTVSPLQNVWFARPVGAAVGLIDAAMAILVEVHVASTVST